MHRFNPETGKFEEVDVHEFVEGLRRSEAIAAASDDPCEVFRHGGDFDQMLIAEKRKKKADKEVA
jgi:hypothetical protein